MNEKPLYGEILDHVIECCDLLDVPLRVILSRTRTVPIPAKRHAIMISTRRKFSLSVKETGGLFSRDHSLISFAEKRCKQMTQPAYIYLNLLNHRKTRS